MVQPGLQPFTSELNFLHLQKGTGAYDRPMIPRLITDLPHRQDPKQDGGDRTLSLWTTWEFQILPTSALGLA